MTLSLRRTVVLALVASLALLAPHAEARRAGRPAGTVAVVGANESSNWAGYNQGILEKGKSGGFHQVSATWVVPTATQHSKGKEEYSSVWVGIGGGCLDTDCLATDSTLIQAGSEEDVAADGTPSYSLWWEVIPGPSIDITNVPVKAGDSVTVDIREVVPNSNLWKIRVTNNSNGKTFMQTIPYSSTHATVEWIVETPLLLGTNAGFSAMPNLDRPTFTAALTNDANPGLVPTEQMALVSGSTTVATPSAPAGGNSFSVCTYATTC